MKHDYLDQAIDHVAARLTHVTEDEGLALRIVTALPERSVWSLHWLMPRLAITAGLTALAITVVLRTFDDGSTDVLRTFDVRSANVQLAVAVPEHRTSEPPLIVRRTIVEPSSNVRRTTVNGDVPDFDRSLPSIGVVASLNFDSLAPDALPESEGLVLEPLVIADLPLTAEPISPR